MVESAHRHYLIDHNDSCSTHASLDCCLAVTRIVIASRMEQFMHNHLHLSAFCIDIGEQENPEECCQGIWIR